MIPNKPITRKEMYYAAILGDTTQVPEPITREEQYLCAIAEQGGSGGGEGYTLPVASLDTLGGVKGPAKTADETEQVHIDEEGNMWVRPGGGGAVPVGNCSEIQTLPGDKKVLLKWQDPPDTEVDGIVVAQWTGTRVVRKEGSYPKDQNDGTIVTDSVVRDQYKEAWFSDSGLENGVTYYYKLFPHAGATYTNSEENQCSETPVEIPLSDVTEVAAKPGNAKVMLTWTDPPDISESLDKDGATWAGTKVMRKTGGAPTSPEDGTEVVNEKTRDQYQTEGFVDSGLENDTEYFYAIYAYTEAGTYSTGYQVSATPYIESPSPCSGLNARAGNQQATITWTDPPASEEKNGQTVTWAGTKLIRKTGSAPETWEDGEMLVNSTEHDAYKSAGYTDDGLDNGTEYFYAVFAYSTDGLYSTDVSTSVTPAEITTDPTLANNSWAQIAEASESGTAKGTWEKGDTIDLVLSGTYNETLTLEIADFEHDNLATGGKAGITFICKNLMIDKQQMNASNTNEGGYKSSKMHTEILPGILESFPEDLKPLVKSVLKTTGLGGGSSEGTEDVECKLFLLSEEEAFGAKTYSVGGEGEQYPIFTDNSSRIKNLSNGEGSANWWWLRSPRSGNSAGFCVVNSGGDAGNRGANTSGGVAFGFSI